jgi:hypothetical protein
MKGWRVAGGGVRGTGGGGWVALSSCPRVQGELSWVQLGVASSGRRCEAAQVAVWGGVARGGPEGSLS